MYISCESVLNSDLSHHLPIVNHNVRCERGVYPPLISQPHHTLGSADCQYCSFGPNHGVRLTNSPIRAVAVHSATLLVLSATLIAFVHRSPQNPTTLLVRPTTLHCPLTPVDCCHRDEDMHKATRNVAHAVRTVPVTIGKSTQRVGARSINLSALEIVAEGFDGIDHHATCHQRTLVVALLSFGITIGLWWCRRRHRRWAGSCWLGCDARR